MNYDPVKMGTLVRGFREGFDLGYRGPFDRSDSSNNLPFHVGDKLDLWNKLMKEVNHKRVAGPYANIPYKYYVQSPVGLVPKTGGQTRMIFHLSYDFRDFKFINHYIPDEYCSVRYRDMDHAVRTSLYWLRSDLNKEGKIYYSKTDVRSAFRLLGLKKRFWCLLIMKARDPNTNEFMYFVEKCVPFGLASSCALFQLFSDALHDIFEFKIGVLMVVTNYLDDFLFVAYTVILCNSYMAQFMTICAQLGVPLAEDKTVWGTLRMIFLGILMLGDMAMLSIPIDKKTRALNMLKEVLTSKKITVLKLQQLTGLLNFLCRAVYPGRVFTRRLYAKLAWKGNVRMLKSHHHVSLDSEFKQDCMVWKTFLEVPDSGYTCRPFIDLQETRSAVQLQWFTDSSAAVDKGFGGVFIPSGEWFFGTWEPNYIRECSPSIAYLELFAVTVSISLWLKFVQHKRIVLYCDNQSVVSMINDSSSKCKNCMRLLRHVVLLGMQHNCRVFAKYVPTQEHFWADSLSRGKIKLFKSKALWANRELTSLPTTLWPASKLWIHEK